jgi:hypothetical protein
MSMQLNQGLAESVLNKIFRVPEGAQTPSGHRCRSEANLDLELDPLRSPPDDQYDV